MAAISPRTRPSTKAVVPHAINGAQILPLHNGDRLTQKEFHRRYEAYPEDVKIELIGGIVYMASPLGRPHGVYHPELSAAYWFYKSATPGVELLDNATNILGEHSEPQPDLALRILSEYGGQTRVNRKGYIKGASELISEIAHSSKAIDLHQKKDDYQQAGAREYVVWCVEEARLYWFQFKPNRVMIPDTEGIYRSHVFPGLWIDSQALADLNSARLIEVVRQGLASPEHAAFVKKLAAAHRKKK